MTPRNRQEQKNVDHTDHRIIHSHCFYGQASSLMNCIVYVITQCYCALFELVTIAMLWPECIIKLCDLLSVHTMARPSRPESFKNAKFDQQLPPRNSDGHILNKLLQTPYLPDLSPAGTNSSKLSGKSAITDKYYTTRKLWMGHAADSQPSRFAMCCEEGKRWLSKSRQ